MTQQPIQPIVTKDNMHEIDAPTAAPSPGTPTAEDLYPDQSDRAVPPGGVAEATRQTQPQPGQGQPYPLLRQTTRTGLQEEVPVWNGRYSLKNFIGRTIFRGVLTLGWIALAIYTWGANHGYEHLPRVAWILGGLLLLSWLFLAWRVILTRLSYFFELTTKRLFIATGVFHRRRDQVELLRIDDLYVKQPTLFHRIFDFGTVVVESSEEKLPISYLAGVDHPHDLMDLIWHHARTERDLHSVKVDEV